MDGIFVSEEESKDLETLMKRKKETVDSINVLSNELHSKMSRIDVFRSDLCEKYDVKIKGGLFVDHTTREIKWKDTEGIIRKRMLIGKDIPAENLLEESKDEGDSNNS